MSGFVEKHLALEYGFVTPPKLKGEHCLFFLTRYTGTAIVFLAAGVTLFLFCCAVFLDRHSGGYLLEDRRFLFTSALSLLPILWGLHLLKFRRTLALDGDSRKILFDTMSAFGTRRREYAFEDAYFHVEGGVLRAGFNQWESYTLYLHVPHRKFALYRCTAYGPTEDTATYLQDTFQIFWQYDDVFKPPEPDPKDLWSAPEPDSDSDCADPPKV